MSRRTMNLWKETIEDLKDRGYNWDDVTAVFGKNYSITKENFEEIAKGTDYDCGYGSQHVAEDLIVLLKDGNWLERGEYDGSEWWQLRKPQKPPKKVVKVKYLAALFGGTLKEANKPDQDLREDERAYRRGKESHRIPWYSQHAGLHLQESRVASNQRICRCHGQDVSTRRHSRHDQGFGAWKICAFKNEK